jgi:ABC-2 type transport system permease protein
MAVETRLPPRGAAIPAIPFHRRLYGFGSIYGKTIRDSRLAFIIMTGFFAGLMLVLGSVWGSTYASPEARAEIAAIVDAVPPIMAGIAGNPVDVGTMGGFLTYKYGPIFIFIAGLWSILALSSTLAGEARRASLDFVAVAPFGKRRIALEKLVAHVTIMVVAMAVMAVAAVVSSSAFGDPALGDEITLVEGIGFGLWVGLLGLVSGSVAFALGPIVGRASAAGVAGGVMLASFIVGNYAPHVPAFEGIANLSWFAWTYDHVPLAGRFDWASLAVVAVITVVLFAVGVELFARRDLGVMTGLPVPGLPRATLGTRGPVGRAFGDQLPGALAWGIGIGIFGFMMAAVSRTFSEQLLTDFPTFETILEAVFPGGDMTSSGWFLQLIFVEMGIIVIGFAAATFVGRWAGDETSGRLEELLATPLTRRTWVVAGGISAIGAAVVTTVLVAVGILLGSIFAGGDVIAPTVGTLVIGFYAIALIGVGVAVGGLWRTSLAAEVVALLVVVTFLVALLAPALELPDWVAELALTTHFGQPMIGQVDPVGIVLSVALAAGGISLGAWGMERRDIAR